MLFFALLVIAIFRWPFLEPRIGTLNMYLIDAMLFTLGAAWNFATPGSLPWLGYGIGVLCVYWAISSMVRYLTLEKRVRDEREAK